MQSNGSAFFDRVGQVFGNLGGTHALFVSACDTSNINTCPPTQTHQLHPGRCTVSKYAVQAATITPAVMKKMQVCETLVIPIAHSTPSTTAAVDAFQARLVDEQVLEQAELRDAQGMQPTLAFCQVSIYAISISTCLSRHASWVLSIF